MSQANWIAFSILLGFFVFITIRGELPEYLAIVGIRESVPVPEEESI